MIVTRWLADNDVRGTGAATLVALREVNAQDAAVAGVPDICSSRLDGSIHNNPGGIIDLKGHYALWSYLRKVRFADDYIRPQVSCNTPDWRRGRKGTWSGSRSWRRHDCPAKPRTSCNVEVIRPVGETPPLGVGNAYLISQYREVLYVFLDQPHIQRDSFRVLPVESVGKWNGTFSSAQSAKLQSGLRASIQVFSVDGQRPLAGELRIQDDAEWGLRFHGVYLRSLVLSFRDLTHVSPSVECPDQQCG